MTVKRKRADWRAASPRQAVRARFNRSRPNLNLTNRRSEGLDASRSRALDPVLAVDSQSTSPSKLAFSVTK